MKAIYLTLSIVLISLHLAAQQPAEPPPALEFRDVTGIVRDENEDPIAGVTVTLKSPLDSLVTTTNSRGLFTFKQVKRAGFYITTSRPGQPAQTVLLRNNDLEKQIILTPIDYGTPKATELREVMINGKPTITYKQDTVEYKAIDYKIRPGDTLDELLKKMDGFYIDPNTGTITYKGEIVGKGRLNGRDFLGGNASQMAKSLPAEIIEKAQVVDYYGEQAAKTGIKNTEPEKMLNVTTKADRSVGTTISTNAQGGNDNRFNASISALHINANRQIGLAGRISNSQLGVAQGTSGGGGAGTTFSANPSVSYSDHWTKTDLTASYNYNYTDNKVIQKQFGEDYYAGPTPDVKYTGNFNNETSNNSISEGHRAALNYSHTFDKSNNIQVTPNFNYSNNTVNNTSYNDIIRNLGPAFEHFTTNSTNSTNSLNTTYGMTGFYQHIFKDPRRNLSVQMGINSNDTKQNGRQYNSYSFFADETQNNKLRADSVANLQTRKTSNNTRFNTTVTYVEPLTKTSQIQFSGAVNHTVIDNVAKTDTVQANGQLKELTRLSNIFNYAFTETRLQLNYSYTSNRVTLSAGASMLPTTLTGTMVNNNNNQTVSSSLNNFRVIPVLSFSYYISATEKAGLYYSGNNTIPDFQQIQPFTDRSNPLNVIIGNPNLKPTFTNRVSASYDKYIPESKINITLTVNASDIKNKVTTNNILRPGIKVSGGADININETNFVNLDGSHAVGANYTFNKQLADKRYNLLFSGSVNYGYDVAMGNNVQYHTTTWQINQRFGPRINTEIIEVNPYIAYNVRRVYISTAGSATTNLQTTSLAIDGRFFFGDWRPNYSVSKNFVKGLGPLNTNPLIINAGIEKQLSKKNALFLTFNVYDILKQNNFVQQSVTPTRVTNTLSNTLSRYFMIGLRAQFQHWGGRPKRNGKDLQRKGDGSFIY
ncbi:TonB-dependent receptor [Mucilaginibacter puniceus]